MKLWQGLGYYSRARNLQKAARQIMENFGEYSQTLMTGSALWPGSGTIPRGRWPPLPLAFRFRRWMGTSCGW